MIVLDDAALEGAHKHCACHREEVQKSSICGCFQCLSNYPPSEIIEWIEETGGNFALSPDPWTALCPRCSIDAVIGDASKYPAADASFLRAMNARWFG